MGGPAICGAGAARVPNWASDGYRAATSVGMMPLPRKSEGSDASGPELLSVSLRCGAKINTNSARTTSQHARGKTHGSSRLCPFMSVMSRSSGGAGTAPCVCHTAPKAFCSGWKEPCATMHHVEKFGSGGMIMVCRWFRCISQRSNHTLPAALYDTPLMPPGPATCLRLSKTQAARQGKSWHHVYC